MFTDQDLLQIKSRGSDLDTIKKQIQNFCDGFPFIQLESAATPGNGMKVLSKSDLRQLMEIYDKQGEDLQIEKFVPASGAASRMFKMLFSFLDIADDPAKAEEAFRESEDIQSIRTFFERINDFAFAPDLDEALKNRGKSIGSCFEERDYASILKALLYEEEGGLGYGMLPKGLLKFHRYGQGARTPAQEHMVEGALYARSANERVNIHFTVSPEHRSKFEQHIRKTSPEFEQEFDVTYGITFTEQKAHTDTIAVDMENNPFRNPDGTLLFRPAGHGALIENLNDIDADIIFIKNIDNVVPDRLKDDTVRYKKALAAVLLEYQDILFGFMHKLDTGALEQDVDEMLLFVKEKLCIKSIPAFESHEEKVNFLKEKFNRPLRVCGMVKNEGEPGGGPFYVYNPDGTVSLQIVESSQIDFNDEKQKAIAQSATHFNPVDLICAVKNYKGEKFDLTKYVDPSTGFISVKSKDGKELKAQELPGLWNGAMAGWNTIFVEVPISTFNPVKTVNDLLRPQHQ